MNFNNYFGQYSIAYLAPVFNYSFGHFDFNVKNEKKKIEKKM